MSGRSGAARRPWRQLVREFRIGQPGPLASVTFLPSAVTSHNRRPARGVSDAACSAAVSATTPQKKPRCISPTGTAAQRLIPPRFGGSVQPVVRRHVTGSQSRAVPALGANRVFPVRHRFPAQHRVCAARRRARCSPATPAAVSARAAALEHPGGRVPTPCRGLHE